MEQHSSRPTRQAALHRGWKEGRYDMPTTEAYRISLRAALRMNDRKSQMLDAIREEIINIFSNNVVKPVKRPKTNCVVVHAHMFVKIKYKADGSFYKVKARLVANGDEQPLDTLGETRAPTVNQISVITLLNYVVLMDCLLSAYDIKGAFLKRRIEEGKLIYIWIGPQEASLWVSVYPQHSQFVDEKGGITFQLLAYMYGLCEAPSAFHSLLDEVLKSVGFVSTKSDECLYIRKFPDQAKPMVVAVHVDDILVASPSKALQKQFENQLQLHFEIVAQYGNLSYLGMSIQYNEKRRVLRATQEGFVKDLVKKYACNHIRKHPTTPYPLTLFNLEDNNNKNGAATPVDKRDFLSLIMSLMFVARFTRPDILLPVSILATYSNPTSVHMAAAIRVVKYLAANTSIGITFKGNSAICPAVYADASHNVYPNGHGQGGFILTLGSGSIICKSFKLKSVTRSSSESELYALEEATTYAIRWKEMLVELQLMTRSQPITIYQDNLSTILLATNGGNFKRTKHLVTREFFVKQHIRDNTIILRHKPTNQMSADFLTKTVNKEILSRCLKELCVN